MIRPRACLCAAFRFVPPRSRDSIQNFAPLEEFYGKMDLPDESIKPKLGISGENEVFMAHLDVPEGAGEAVADRQRAVKTAKTCARK